MDPVSALALSCNILDLLELGIKAGRVVKEIYKEPDGLRERHQALLDQANTLSTVAAGLQQAQSTIALSPVDARMRDVSTKCSAVCRKIEARRHQVQAQEAQIARLGRWRHSPDSPPQVGRR